MKVKVIAQPKPGDTIFFMFEGTKISDVVKNTLWQDAPKGGKVWTYETEGNHMVAFGSVLDFKSVNSASLAEIEIPAEMIQGGRQITLSNNSTIEVGKRPAENQFLATAIHCIQMGDIGNLVVANHLIQKRIKELLELQTKNSLENQRVTSTSPNGL